VGHQLKLYLSGPNYSLSGPPHHHRVGRAKMTTLLRPEIITVPELIERCDSCGAAAKLEVTLTSGGSLAFCGHHANKNAAGLALAAAKVTREDGFEWTGKVPSL
jgi:hypothetical protein